MSAEFWWLWVVLGFLVIALLFFLWGRRRENPSANMARPAVHEFEESPLRSESATFGAQDAPDQASEPDRMVNPDQAVEPDPKGVPIQPVAPDQPEQSYHADKPDQLEIIEGIGPKIAEILRAEGIGSFTQLAGTDAATLEEILARANLSQLTDPETWSQQAALAAQARWEELKELQQSLKGGRAAENG